MNVVQGCSLTIDPRVCWLQLLCCCRGGRCGDSDGSPGSWPPYTGCARLWYVCLHQLHDWPVLVAQRVHTNMTGLPAFTE
jgi:hypothetical protein